MKHDFADEAYCRALRHLFHPGNGVMPPKLAGRSAEEKALGGMLEQLLAGAAADRDAILYGPRGNGKTVLLRKFEETCRAAGVSVVEVRPKLIKSHTDLAGLLLHHDDDAMAGLLEHAKPDEVRLGLPGIGGIGWKGLPQSEKDTLRARHLEGLLRVRCRQTPLVVTVDEAHTLRPDMGRTLLNLSEALRKQGAPFLLALSGTPNLETRLEQMDASFWGRSRALPIGRLDEAATREALASPLGNLSITFETAALDKVTADSQYYPYFIQLWGKALCDALVQATQEQTITSATVAKAAEAVNEQREGYYGQRYEELERRGLLAPAGVLAATFKGRDQLHKAVLLRALTRDLGIDEQAGQDALGALADLGYTWRAKFGEDDTEPGIPSLMTHVQVRLQASQEALREQA
ncbi:MAG: ATP-binding protein [Gammaproteobacteria bacterium]|nr:ATP-binding protein [Gammaproteobacteria bacterium]